MKKIRFKSDSLVFLYAYFRQADRFLALKDYNSAGSMQPAKVAAWLAKKAKMDLPYKPAAPKPGEFGKGEIEVWIIDTCIRMICGYNYLTYDEVVFLYSCLLRFDEFLQGDFPANAKEKENPELYLLTAAYDILEFKISISDRGRYLKRLSLS
jgi:hypothetical protein